MGRRLIDLTNQRFGRWTVLYYDPQEGTPRWRCRCDCGTERSVLSHHLKNISCGCARGGIGKRLNDLTGQKFGRLLVLGVSHIASNKQTCLCDCGAERIVRSSHLGSSTFSCGCYAVDNASLMNTKHGHAMTIRGKTKTSSTYGSWHSMMTRCNNPNFKYWGGRGIKVCERWHDFRNFLADMGERPEGKTLDRYPNPDGNYEPGNCRWATYSEQRVNRSKLGSTT